MKIKVIILSLLFSFFMFSIASSISLTPEDTPEKFPASAEINSIDLLPESDDIIAGIAAAAAVMSNAAIEDAILY